MNKSKSADRKEVDVQFNKYTGGFSVDIREVIEEELERIKATRRGHSHALDNTGVNTDGDWNENLPGN